MSAVSLVLILLAATALVRFLSERLNVPHAVLLVLGGLALAVTPGLPRATLDPDLVFLIFLPPLLYSAAIRTSWRDFQMSLRPILLLGVGLVSVTILAVAAIAHAVVGLAWAPAFVLGAIISPPDAVAAIAMTRQLRIRRTLRTVLRGGRLVNDATAFVAYRMAVKATISGTFSAGSAALQFAIAGAGGIAVGLAVGYAVVSLRRRLPHLAEAENTISLLTPFAAFIPAELLGLSSVLAVVAVGLYVGHQAPRFISPGTRVQVMDMWTLVAFMLEGLIFILVGLDLPEVLRTRPRTLDADPVRPRHQRHRDRRTHRMDIPGRVHPPGDRTMAGQNNGRCQRSRDVLRRVGRRAWSRLTRDRACAPACRRQQPGVSRPRAHHLRDVHRHSRDARRPGRFLSIRDPPARTARRRSRRSGIDRGASPDGQGGGGQG